MKWPALTLCGSQDMRPNRSLNLRALLLFCAGTMITMAATAAEPTAPMARGIVVDGEAGIAYIADGRGHPQAIDLASGEPRWRSDHIGLPLALANGRLLVLASHVDQRPERIDLLDPATGDAHGHIELALPEGVHVVVVPRPDRRFEVALSGTGAALRLHWAHSSRPLRGDLPDEAAPPTAAAQSGAFDLDLAAVRAHAVSAQAAPTLPHKAPNLQANERLPQVPGEQFRAADERHVLASEAITDAQFGTAYRWNIHARDSGAKLGSVHSPHAAAAFIVHAATVVARVDPYALRQPNGTMHYRNSRIAAFDLASGRELWSRDVLEPRFRGLMPP